MSSVVIFDGRASTNEENACQEVAERLGDHASAHKLKVWSAKGTFHSDPTDDGSGHLEKFNTDGGDEAALPTLLQSRSRGLALDHGNDAKDPRKTADKPVVEADHGSDVEDAEAEEQAASALDEEARRHAAERAKVAEFFWTAAKTALRERDRREKVAAFLKAHQFSAVNARRGWFWNYDYPLHCAAKHADVEMVRLLLVSKAVRRQKDCDGRTARAVAKGLNFFGSYDDVIKALTGKKRGHKAGVKVPVPAAGTPEAALPHTEAQLPEGPVKPVVFGRQACQRC